jgi:hypothetical protein
VRGRGELKDNMFVPKDLIVWRPQKRIMMGGPGEEQKKPDGTQPSGTAAPAPPK